QTASTASRSRPRIAAIAPVPTGTASCISSPRRRTMRTASAKASAPATTSAEYSPRPWPATRSGRRPCPEHAAAPAPPPASTAAWSPRGSRLGQRDVDRRGAGIAVAIDVDEHLVHGQPHALAGRLDDAQVGLVRDEEIDVLGAQAVAPQELHGGVLEHPDRDLE